MDWFKKSLQEQDDSERDKLEFCTLSQVGNDGGFDKGNCKKKKKHIMMEKCLSLMIPSLIRSAIHLTITD